VTHSGPIDERQRRWVAVLGAGGVRVALLGGLSALTTLGFRGFDQPVVHVLVPASTMIRRTITGVRIHRTAGLPDTDVHRMGNPPGTMPARSLIDAAQWATRDDQARAIIAAGFQQRLVSSDDITPVLARMPRARRRALIAEAVADGSAGAHSVPEADFLRLCRRAGLPVPALQHRRDDATGRRRYLDAYFTDFRVHVEVDGGQHTDVRQWWDDMQRQNELWIAGDRVLRFPSWAIRHRSDEVRAQLTAALSAAGWRPN
jgi:very-short-patch-repair endonuclease